MVPAAGERRVKAALRPFLAPQTALFVAVWLALLLSGRSRLFQDPGVFWHTVVGRQIIEQGRVPRADGFSFTFGGEPWVASQWLGECAMAALYDALGLDGLLLATATLLAALYAWLGHRLLRAGVAPAAVALAVAMAVAGGSHHFHPRPHLATIVLLAWTVGLLCDVESGRRSLRWLAWLPPAVVLWSNLHGGVLAGAALAAMALAGWTLAAGLRRPSPVRGWRGAAWLAGVLVACGLAMLVNPYGAAMPRTWLRVMSLDLPELIEEHAPLDLLRPEGWMTLGLAGAYLVVLAGAARRGLRVSWLLPLVLLYLAIDRVRHSPLFAVAAVVVAADALPQSRVRSWLAARGWWSEAGAARGAPGWKAAALPAILVAAAAALQVGEIKAPLVGRGWARLDPALWPVEIVPELTQASREVAGQPRILNSLDLGGFLVLHTPRWRVFIDDRCELFGGDFLREYVAAERGDTLLVDVWADRYDVRYALARSGTAMDAHLASSEAWRLVRRAQAAALYQRAE